MNEPNHQSEAARFAVAPECSAGTIAAGWRQAPIQVLEVSRTGFTILVSTRIANKMKRGRSHQLNYRGESSLVVYDAVKENRNGRVAIQVTRLCDVTKQEYRGGSLFSLLSGNRKVQPTDPTLPVGVVIGIVVILLITPGWGDELGTSQYLTELVTAVSRSIREIVVGS